MASKGTRGTAIAFGSFEITVSLKKCLQSRDPRTEYVNAAGEKVTVSGGYAGGSRKPADGIEKAVRVTDTHVVRLPADRLAAIEEESKAAFGQMQVLEVIDYRQVPTERIVGSYWMQPSRGSSRGLALLATALRDSGKVAVVKWVASSREKLGVIRVRGERGRMALLLSEVTHANDFLVPDEDALAINEVELDERSLSIAANLIESFARDGEAAIDTASDTAVDARIALVDEMVAAQTTAALDAFAAGGLSLRNVITATVTWSDDVEAALVGAGIDPDAAPSEEQVARSHDLSGGPLGRAHGPSRALWIATGEGAEVVSIEEALREASAA